MKKITKLLLIPAATLPAVLAFAGMASAHGHVETETCAAGIHADGNNYQGGHLDMAIGSKSFATDFTAGYSHDLPNPDKAQPETWHITVTSTDGIGGFTISGTLAACETPVTTTTTTGAPASTTTTTTSPASTTTAPPASTTTTSTSAPASTTTPPDTSQPANDTTVPTASTSPPDTTISSEPSSTTVTTSPESSTTAAQTPTATTQPDCNLPPSPAQCINPRHEIVATCDTFRTDGDGWSDQMHADIQIGAEHLPTDMFAWVVTRGASVLGTDGYTYRVTVTDAAAGAYDSGLVTVPACGKLVVVNPPVSTPTELPSTGFFVDLLLALAAVFIITGLVIRYASRRTHL